jgi:hypothetical protein
MNLPSHLAAALAVVASTTAFAQADATLAIPPRAQVASVLNLDSRRAQAVEAILADAHARMAVARSHIGAPMDDTSRVALLTAVLLIRYETDAQLASVLSPDEFARLKETVYPAGWVRAMPARGTPM